MVLILQNIDYVYKVMATFDQEFFVWDTMGPMYFKPCIAFFTTVNSE